MESRQDEAQRQKRIFQQINRFFMIYDLSLVLINLVLTLIFVMKRCTALTFLIYFGLYLFQALQHYFIRIFPKIDINKHHVLYRRTIILIGFVDTGYLFANVMFWSRQQSHPIYCLLCVELQIGLWIGLLMVIHFFIIALWFFMLINSYIQRRYYLLALGGYEAEQRIIQQRQRRLQEMMIIEPIQPLPLQNQWSKKVDKYFKFEDVIQEQIDENYECSICLNASSKQQKIEDRFVNAGCGHLYHQQCLRTWVIVNSNCPQCRTKIRQSIKEQYENKQKEQKNIEKQNKNYKQLNQQIEQDKTKQ